MNNRDYGGYAYIEGHAVENGTCLNLDGHVSIGTQTLAIVLKKNNNCNIYLEGRLLCSITEKWLENNSIKTSSREIYIEGCIINIGYRQVKCKLFQLVKLTKPDGVVMYGWTSTNDLGGMIYDKTKHKAEKLMKKFWPEFVIPAV